MLWKTEVDNAKTGQSMQKQWLSFNPFSEQYYFHQSTFTFKNIYWTIASESMAEGWIEEVTGKIDTAIMFADNGHQGVIWGDQKEEAT